VVEDDADVRDSVAELLKLEGYRVITAQNGQEGLERLNELSHPCLLLLDLRMPVMDGHALLESMERIDDFRSVPVVVMTAEEVRKHRMASAVLSKPFEPDRLLSAVGAYCH
jgi:CheY-like chemotaxis protein